MLDEATPHPRAALSDVRVVSLEQYAAGPYGTLLLSDLGADIIKIEQPGSGDVGRQVPPFGTTDDSLFFQSLNRNKRSVCIDLSIASGRSVFNDLVRVSDAVYSNLRGDVPAKLGIRYDDLKHLNPLIVCCTLSGYGLTGPLAAMPGFDYMIQGLAGWMSITGEPDGLPTKSGMSAVDFASGIAASMSTIVGIHSARRDGRGCDCDVALLDTALSFLNYLATWSLSKGFDPGRIPRSSHPSLVPFGTFPTADGWIVAGGSKEKFWLRMVSSLGLEHLADDPRFRTFDERRTNRDELLPILDVSFRQRTTSEWLGIFESNGVPCAPVNSIGEALAHPQVHARELVYHQEHPVFGSIGQVDTPLRVGDHPHDRRLAPQMGEHTVEVLQDLLGYTTTDITKLARAGAIYAPTL